MSVLLPGVRGIPLDCIFWQVEPTLGVVQVWEGDPKHWRLPQVRPLGAISLMRLEDQAALLDGTTEEMLCAWLNRALDELGVG